MMFSRNRTNGSWNVIRVSLQRFYTTNRGSYFKLLKFRLRDTESNYIRSLKRNTTSMVSVLRNGNHLHSSLNKGFGNTLWRYFNSPFNVVFMTTNIFAFAGIVAFSTLIDIRHLHNFTKIENSHHQYDQEHQLYTPDNYVLASPSNVRKHMYLMMTTLIPNSLTVPEIPINITDEEIVSTPKSQDKTLEMLQRKVTEKTQELEDMEVDTPFHTYNVEDIEINSKNKRVVDYNSAKIKADLFNMLYSFKIYEDVIVDTQANKHHQKLWFEELLHFRNKHKDVLATGSSKIDPSFRPTVTNFYDAWRTTYQKMEPRGGDLIENFTLPNWSQYPYSLKDSCNKLYENKMGGIDDFKSFYDSIKSNKFKKLIRMWYYDNYKLIKCRQSNDTNVMAQREEFYNELLKDSLHDPPTFVKYASIVLNPHNPRKDILFSKINPDDNQATQQRQHTNNIPVVQVETVLNILQGYLTLQQEKKRTKILNYNNTYLRIVHMIKENGYLTDEGKIGIQLCPDDQVIYSHRKWLSKNRQDPKLYDRLGKDPHILQLLSQITT